MELLHIFAAIYKNIYKLLKNIEIYINEWSSIIVRYFIDVEECLDDKLRLKFATLKSLYKNCMIQI